MAKFCGNCGIGLKDDAKVCGQCGTPVDGISAGVSGAEIADSKKKQKKKFKRILTLTVLLLVAIVSINIVLRFTGYNGLLRKVMNAYENCDIEALVSLSGDMYHYDDDGWAEYYFEYAVVETLDFFEHSVGRGYKLSYEVNESRALSRRNLDNMLTEIEDAYPDFDVAIIEKVVAADLTVTAKQGKKSVSRDIDIIMSKEGGSWKLLYIE